MAASVDSHSNYCKKLFRLLRKAPLTADDNRETGSILASSNELVLVWDNFSSCFRTSHQNKDVIQTLLCSNPPLFSVTSVIFNSTEDNVALVGNKGIAIMEMPTKYGAYGLFENGKEKILCKSLLVDERYFCSHVKERVVKVLWHPGSPNCSHLCVLTSDNMLRIYNVAKPECAFQTISLNGGKSGSKFAAALESFVSMTFGSSIETVDQQQTIWPLYLLTELGDVYVVNSSLWSSTKPTVEGPLKMPVAEDNYDDACDILHLSSSPEVLVVSTVTGSLIHCVLLPDEGYGDEDGGESGSHLPLLYVYDIVKLELFLSVPSNTSTGDCTDLDYTTPLKLVKDPVSSDRYLCMHTAGVHSIQLPWLLDIETISSSLGGGRGDGIPSADSENRSICQHVLCTRPLSETKPCPLRGLAVVPDDINTTSLLCLLSDFICIKVMIRKRQAANITKLISTVEPGDEDEVLDRRSFGEHIRQLLSKESTNPLIKTGSEQTLSSEQSYQLLARATQVFREQYVAKLQLAKKELDRRVNSLEMIKEQQREDLDILSDQRTDLTDTARDLAERYEDVLSHHDVLIDRVEKVMSVIQKSISNLSEAERSLTTHLETRERDVEQLQVQLDQVKKKHKFQRESLNKQVDTGPCLSESQLKIVNGILADESEQISNLVRQLRSMMSAAH